MLLRTTYFGTLVMMVSRNTTETRREPGENQERTRREPVENQWRHNRDTEEIQ